MLTIDDLPDDDLLKIFDFYVIRSQDLDFVPLLDQRTKTEIESWQLLVHVCRRWRGLVFGSPRCLNLQLVRDTGPSERKATVDVWPALPFLLRGAVSTYTMDHVIADLQYSDRICQLEIFLNGHFDTTWQVEKLEKLWIAMQDPFPELTVLHLSTGPFSYEPVLSDSFLGGSAPRLRYFFLKSILFPGLSKLLLSATHLVELCLVDIPRSGYISPEAMVTSLSMLTCLDKLYLGFASPQFHPDLKSRHLPSLTRSVLPALTEFSFEGVNEYLERLLAHIDAPRLNCLSTKFFLDINFNAPDFTQFISRTPTLGTYDEAHLTCNYREYQVSLCQSHREPSGHKMVNVRIVDSDQRQASDRRLSALARVCTTSSLRHFLTMESLYIDGNEYTYIDLWNPTIRNTEWLDLLLAFTAVKNLYLSKLFSRPIAVALQELTGGRTMEVLPALKNVFLEGFHPSEPVNEGIARFVSARQLANHPVAISVWDRFYV